MLAAIAAIAALAIGSATPTCNPNNVTQCVVPLQMGEVAPFAGQLLTPTLALELADEGNSAQAKLQAYIARCAADADIEQKKNTSLQLARENEFESSLKTCRSGLTTCQQQLEAGTPWYKSVWFWVPVTAVVTTASVCYGIHYAGRTM